MVTAQLPAFAQPGQVIDVTVSSMGNAKSLRGGTLLLTPLAGADGQIYAMAQGNVVVGGAGASAGGSKVQINHLSAGRIPGGATVERAVPTRALAGDVSADSSCSRPISGTARRGGRGHQPALRRRLGRMARSMPGWCRCGCPTRPDARVAFLARAREASR